MIIDKGKRLIYLEVSVWYLQEFLKTGEAHIKVTSGLPKDARIIRVEFPDVPSVIPKIILVVESKEYQELNDSDLIPKIEPPLFEKLN